jgi:hypothetical protein
MGNREDISILVTLVLVTVSKKDLMEMEARF